MFVFRNLFSFFFFFLASLHSLSLHFFLGLACVCVHVKLHTYFTSLLLSLVRRRCRFRILVRQPTTLSTFKSVRFVISHFCSLQHFRRDFFCCWCRSFSCRFFGDFYVKLKIQARAKMMFHSNVKVVPTFCISGFLIFCQAHACHSMCHVGKSIYD